MAGTDSRSFQPPAVEGETPSPLCNHLLEYARLRFEDEMSEEDLRNSAQTALASLEQARGQTLANLERDGANDDVLGAFEQSFEEMQIALEDLEDFASNVTEQAHDGVRASLMRAASATVFAMSTLQQAQFADGPTEMPLFNALFKMKDNFLQGAVAGDQLKQALSNIVEMTKAAIEELLQAEGEQPPQRDGLVRAYQEQIENLELAGKTVDGGDKQKVEEVFQQLLVTSNGVRDAIGSLNVAIMSKGPCRLARANILLSAAEAFFSGGISVDAFAESLEAFENEIREELDQFAELAAMPNETESVQEEIESARIAYELHEDAIALFSELIEGEFEQAEFEKAKKMLIQASEMLSDRKEKLTELGENEGKVSCVRCGASNEIGSRVCSSCGAQLPQQQGTASTMSYQESDGTAGFAGGDELDITENLERLFNAVNDVAEEKCSDEDFEEVLVWMDNLLANAQTSIPDVPDLTPLPDFEEEHIKQLEAINENLHGQREVLLVGISEFRRALGTLQSFFETREKDTLIQGVREVRDGALKMQQADRALKLITENLDKAREAAAKAAEEDSEEEAEPN